MARQNDKQILDGLDQVFESPFTRIVIERGAPGVMIRDGIDGPVRATGETPREALRQWLERGAPAGVAEDGRVHG